MREEQIASRYIHSQLSCLRLSRDTKNRRILRNSALRNPAFWRLKPGFPVVREDAVAVSFPLVVGVVIVDGGGGGGGEAVVLRAASR